jgi:quinol monooxygenase YgiN
MVKTSMFAKFTAVDGKRDEVVTALEKALEAVEAEVGTERYLICTDLADPSVVWMYEQYTDDAALGVHGSSPAVATLFGDLGGLLEKPAELSMAKLVSGKGIE